MKKLSYILLLILSAHIAVSFVFILAPPFLNATSFSRIYKTYLLPGPFFRDDRITTSYNLSTSWKARGQWSIPYSHSRKYFDEYYESVDPADLYRSRCIRFFDQVFSSEKLLKGEIKQLSEFEKAMVPHVPSDVDSIHIIVTRKYAIKFVVQVDTVINIRLNAPAEKI